MSYTLKQFVSDCLVLLSPGFHAESRQRQQLLHASIGLATESYELRNAFTSGGLVKDRTNLAEEIGDILWYHTILIRELGWSQDELLLVDNERTQKHRYAGNLELLNEIHEVAIDLLDYLGKKMTFYGKTPDQEVIKSKAGVLVSALSELAKANTLLPEECMVKVTRKLQLRYPEGKFSLQRAEVRDLEAERKELEL